MFQHIGKPLEGLSVAWLCFATTLRVLHREDGVARTPGRGPVRTPVGSQQVAVPVEVETAARQRVCPALLSSAFEALLLLPTPL